jgi:hypothetical protein
MLVQPEAVSVTNTRNDSPEAVAWQEVVRMNMMRVVSRQKVFEFQRKLESS